MPEDVSTATEAQITRILSVVEGVLGRSLVGAYLYGSAILGGLKPRSDIDILVVSRRRTTRDEKQRLVAGLLRASGRYDPSTTKAIEGRRPLDLTIVVEPEIRPWRYPPSFDFQYGEWLRRDFEGGNLEPWPTTTNPDVASLITMALQANRPLFGPPPGEVLDPVPRADYMRAIASEVGPQLKGLDGDTCNGLLTLARIWATVSTGELKAKDDAATWAISRLPEEHRPVLARARAIYLGEEKDRWEDISAQFRSCADYLAREIRRVGG